MITLPIKKQWFDLIDNGIKKEEYRAITPRYTTMFNNVKDDNDCFWCRLRNGYSSTSPTLEVFVKCSVGYGRSEWGAEPNQQYFVLSILDIHK